MADAQAIALKYMTPRYQRLDKYESYIDGTQYDGKPPFLAGGDDAPPVHERAPCIVYGLPKTATNDIVSFMMGEDRYPRITATTSEDDEELDDEWGLDKEEAELFEKWINGPLTKAARLKAMFPDALTMAMHAGGVALVAVVRNGQPCLHAMPAKWCVPTFNTVTNEVTSLEIFYPYIIDVQNRDGKWEQKCMLYRRVITTTLDTVYLPGEGREDGKMPAWLTDESQSFTHGLGYCPVRWYAFDRLIPTAANYDGRPIHYSLLDEVDALNLSLSMRHRAALYAGDPQIWETGVDSNVNPAPMGRFGRVTVEAQASGPGGQTIGVYTASPREYGRGSARKKGPGVVWRYPSDLSKVGVLALPGDALTAIDEHANDLRKKMSEDMSVVLIDPADAKVFGALSGKALAFLFARQVARADRIRQDAGDNLILACIDLLLRLCLTVETKTPGGLRIPGMKKMLPVLKKFENDEQVTAVPGPDGSAGAPSTKTSWFGPRLDLQWGPYFPMSAEEENFLMTMCVAAYTNKLMPMELILEKLRDIFPFGSTEELMEMLQAEADQARQDALDDAAHTADQTGAVAIAHTVDPVTGKAPSGGKPVLPPRAPRQPKTKKGSTSGAKGDKAA